MLPFLERGQRTEMALKNAQDNKSRIVHLYEEINGFALLLHDQKKFTDEIKVGSNGLFNHYGILDIRDPVDRVRNVDILVRLGVPMGFFTTHLPTQSVYIDCIEFPNRGRLRHEEYIASAAGVLWSLSEDHKTYSPVPPDEIESRIELLEQVLVKVGESPLQAA
jgi:hypothetical protein